MKGTLEPITRPATADARPPGEPFRPGNLGHPGKGHIGLTVAGSLLSGLVAAIVLVAGPVAGSQEHVITGAVLLAFAFGWAMLRSFPRFGQTSHSVGRLFPQRSWPFSEPA